MLTDGSSRKKMQGSPSMMSWGRKNRMESQTDLEPAAKKIISIVIAAAVVVALLMIFGII